MKRLFLSVVMVALVLALAPFSYAKYLSGYKVIEVAGQQVTIQKGKEDPITVTVKRGEYKVGDEVRYDADKLRLRRVETKKPFEGC